MSRPSLGVLVVALVVVVASFAGHVGPSLAAQNAEVRDAKPRPDARRCARAPVRRAGNARYSFAAVVRRVAPTWRRPGRGRIARFKARNQNGAPMVFAVLGVVRGGGCKQKWYRVQLPTRPNGLTGFVRARDVSIARIWTRVEVDLSDRRLTVYRRGRPVLRARVAVGTPRTPTPTGRYYVNQRLLTGNARGPYGPGAVGISAFSPVLQGWAQGGPIAIHGTNQPWSIGRAASHGCIRVFNPVVSYLMKRVFAGTPVEVRA